MNLWDYDSSFGSLRVVSKAEVMRWVRRVREDLRDLEKALREGDFDALRAAVEDANGSTGELARITETTAEVRA